MNFIPFTPPQIATEPQALVTVVARKEVTWYRPERHIFRAPPLDVRPPLADVAELAATVRPDLALAS